MDANYEYQPFFAFNVISRKFLTENPTITTGDINFHFSFLEVFTDWISRQDLAEPQFVRHVSHPVINNSVRVRRHDLYSEETKRWVEDELWDCFHVAEYYRIRGLVDYAWRQALKTIMSNPSCYNILDLEIYVLFDHRHIFIDPSDFRMIPAADGLEMAADHDEHSLWNNFEMGSFGLEELFSVGADDGSDTCEEV